ncbi:MAG: carbohydrate kinase family protein [Planctomycetota bacterium]
MGKRFDVVCAGIIVADHLAAPIDVLPAAGQLVLTDACFLSIGGCASNVGVDLAKMNVHATVCGCIGDDSFGTFAKGVLEEAGVDTSGVTTIPGVATSQTLIINVKGQDRRFIHHLGANRLFAASHFPRDLVRQSKILYVGGYFLLDGLIPEELAAVFRDARSHGVITMLDVVTPGPRDYLGPLSVILPETDYFLPNNDEGHLMTGESDPVAQADLFRKLGAKASIITCGGKGAVYISEKERLRTGVFAVDFVDGTGGGDAFDAGFISGLLQGGDPVRCLSLGSALGASCVRKTGATAGVFRRDEADRYLREHVLTVEPIP